MTTASDNLISPLAKIPSEVWGLYHQCMITGNLDGLSSDQVKQLDALAESSFGYSSIQAHFERYNTFNWPKHPDTQES